MTTDTQRGPVDGPKSNIYRHCRRALEADCAADRRYHIRQAMQLLFAAGEGQP